MIPLSVLDLAPVPEGSTVAEALARTVDLARHAEALGFRRYWLAEHHAMPGIASAATAVLIGHVAGQTRRIRVGAGGIMLPNHAPLMVAEAFGTLATLHPDRIDLGIGRAPGTDPRTAAALRRNLDAGDSFPADVLELLSYLGDPQPGAIVAVPGAGTRVPVWILGSSLYGAQLAAHFGLPYAFASHFAPPALEAAAAVYRETFRPSSSLDRPHFMMAANVFAAGDDATARRLRSSAQLAFAALRAGRPGLLPAPVEHVADHLDPVALRVADQMLAVSATGGPATLRRELLDLIERHRPDELLLTVPIHDPEARLQALTLAAEALA